MNLNSPSNLVKSNESNIKNKNEVNNLNNFDENDTEKVLDNEYP
jgi:hypothetical protein